MFYLIKIEIHFHVVCDKSINLLIIDNYQYMFSYLFNVYNRIEMLIIELFRIITIIINNLLFNLKKNQF